MEIGYYPGWGSGLVLDYLNRMSQDGQRKKAVAKLLYDIHLLRTTWPRTQLITVKALKGHEPLWELSREYQGVAYRIFFCVKGDAIWLLHAIEKKARKTPVGDLDVAHRRMQEVLSSRIRRMR